jgi:hypothetical protein
MWKTGRSLPAAAHAFPPFGRILPENRVSSARPAAANKTFAFRKTRHMR